MGGDDDVPQMAVRGAGLRRIREEPHPLGAHVLHVGIHQLHPHEDGEGDRDEADERRREEVEDTDILVVGGHEPPGEEARMGMITMTMYGCVGHALLPFPARRPDRPGACLVALIVGENGLGNRRKRLGVGIFRLRSAGPALLRRDRGEIGRHVLRALRQLEGHLRLAGLVAGIFLEELRRIGQVLGQFLFVPDEALLARFLHHVGILEIGDRPGRAADHAVEVRAGLAALLDLGAVIGDDRMAGLAFLEVVLAFRGIACRQDRGRESCAGNRADDRKFHGKFLTDWGSSRYRPSF